MKKCFLAISVIFTFGLVNNGFCLDYKNIKKYAEEKYFNPMAKDVGGVLSGGYYHYAKNLGFPGFDIGIRIPVKNISNDNVVLTTNSDTEVIPLTLIQAEIGLPMNFDLIVRGINYEGLSGFGGAIKYTFFSSRTLLDFSISGIIGYTTLTHSYIKANSTSANAIISIGTPIVQPYLGIGYDTTELTAGDKAKEEEPLLEGLKGTSTGTRIEAGLNISPFPFIYLYGGYALIYGDTGYTLGLGIKF